MLLIYQNVFINFIFEKKMVLLICKVIKLFCYLEGGESEENEVDNSKENENEEVCQNFKIFYESIKLFERCI